MFPCTKLGIRDELKNLGLSGDLYQQILDSGNVEFAKSVLAGGSATVKELNDLAASANSTALKLGEDAGDMLYGKGIEVAQGVYDGLVAKEAQMRALMASIAAEFAAKISAVIAADTTQGADKTTGAKKKTTETKPAAKLTSAEAAAALNKATASASGANPANPMKKLARGGLVNRPIRALVGEAGPEVVTPLKDFERMIGTAPGSGNTINYYAAPNQSLDAEQALFTAIKRGKVIAGW